MNNKRRECIEDQYRLTNELSDVEVIEWDVIAQLQSFREWVVKTVERFS